MNSSLRNDQSDDSEPVMSEESVQSFSVPPADDTITTHDLTTMNFNPEMFDTGIPRGVKLLLFRDEKLFQSIYEIFLCLITGNRPNAVAVFSRCSGGNGLNIPEANIDLLQIYVFVSKVETVQ